MQVLQLKITLQYSRPPIWRRVLIRPDATFWELHSVIQDVFGWEDCHLHSFERAWKRGEERHFFEISDSDSFTQMKSDFATDLFGPAVPQDYFHDELTEKLQDWITEQYPRHTYIYDFGDNWAHDIMLEKTVEVGDLVLAQYVNGKRRSMEEDSRFESVLDCTTIIKAADNPSDRLWQSIVEDIGNPAAKALLAEAQSEAGSAAPEHIKISNPKQRYKDAKAMGMFE